MEFDVSEESPLIENVSFFLVLLLITLTDLSSHLTLIKKRY